MGLTWLYRFFTGEVFILKFKDSPSPPPAPAVPDPSVQTAAQAKALPSIYSPFGNSVYSGDPTAGTFRQDVTLSPDESAKYSGRNNIAKALLGRTEGAIGQLPAGNFTFSPRSQYAEDALMSMSAAPRSARAAFGDFNFMEPSRDSAQLDKLTGFANASTPVSGSAVQQAFFDKQKSLLDPVYQRDEGRLDQKLANQGLPIGSEAHSQAMDEFNRGKALAYDQASQGAVQAGADETARQRQQSYAEIAGALGGSQAQTGAQFSRSMGTRQQNVAQFSDDAARNDARNQALLSGSINLDAAGRERQLQERQQRFNEIAQALGGSQLQGQPGGAGTSPLDVNGAYANQQAGLNRQYQGQLAGYNADVAGQNSAMGGLFGLGAAGIAKYSDRRLKREIVDLGEILPGIRLYEYEYVWGGARERGVMADEAERVMPEAVLYDAFGYQMVDYGMLFAGRSVH